MKKHNGTLALPVRERQRIGDDSHLNLSSLKEGKSIAFRIKGAVALPKARVPEPVLFIVPGVQFGDPDSLMFSLQGAGCEVSKKSEVKPATLVRVGLTAAASRMLVAAIRSTFPVDEIL